MRKLKRFARRRKTLILRAVSIAVPMVMALMLLSQTAFAKNTYVITDGTRVFTYTTFATNPAEVLGEAGLELDENDTYTTSNGVGMSSITVRRSQDITIEYYGEVIHATSFGESVEHLLNRLNISLGTHDAVSVDLSAQTYDGMALRIDTVIQQEETYTTTLAHETTYCSASYLPAGVKEVLTQGSDGEVLCTASVTYINGVEAERTVLSQDVTIHPVNALVAVGTGDPVEAVDTNAMPIIGDGTITLPTGEVLTYTHSMICDATSYCDTGLTATGSYARYGAIAVDPDVIPYGTRMFIISTDGEYIYGIATAEDTGHPDFISGDRIDLWLPTESECVAFGNRDCIVYFLGSE